jgi:hypothetical protein
LNIFGTHTNNHIESYHRKIKRELNSKLNFYQMLEKLLVITRSYKRDQGFYLYKNIGQSTNPNFNDELTSILKNLMTPMGMSLIDEQWKLVKNFDYKYEKKGNDAFVVSHTNTSKEYLVRITKTHVSCRCNEFCHFNFMCRHILFVLKENLDSYSNLLPQFVNSLNIRWNKNKTIQESFLPEYTKYNFTQPNSQKIEKIEAKLPKRKILSSSEKYSKYRPIIEDLEIFLESLGTKRFNQSLVMLKETVQVFKDVILSKDDNFKPSKHTKIENDRNREYKYGKIATNTRPIGRPREKSKNRFKKFNKTKFDLSTIKTKPFKFISETGIFCFIKIYIF